MVHGVAEWAAVLVDWEAEDQAAAAGEVETDQGPVQVVEDPDPGFLRI